MKCDELKQVEYPIEWGIYYDKSEVDAAIAELKARIQLDDDEMAGFLQLEEECGGGDLRNYIAELKRKLEDVQASAYAESVDAGMENRRLKRALWLAHEYKAKFKRWWLHLALDYEASMIRPDAKTINRIKGKIGNCEKSERKCRAKAEEYK